MLHLLHPGERIELALRLEDTQVRATDRRLIVTEDSRVRMDLAYDELRRVQFDVEAIRPAVMVIVPHHVRYQAQILNIPREQLQHAAEVVAFIGERLP
jgi:hypothetical protein